MTGTVHRSTRLVLLVVLVAFLVTTLLLVSGKGEEDFLVYWSAARLLATGGNPYDPITLRGLEHQARPDRVQQPGQGFAAWNPPWLLLVLLPLGLLPFDVAVAVWTVCNIALITTASLLTWSSLAQPNDQRGMLIVLTAGLWFGASLSTIQMGQISSLVLIGLVLSAWWLHAGRDWLAGAVLFLTTVKPHVTYFVCLLLLLWVIRHRRWRVLGGMGVAGAISALMLWVVFPGWVWAYSNLAGGHPFLQYSTSTLGGLAYALWGTNLLRFAGILLLPLVPSVLHLADSRGWLTAMNVALLVSVPLAIYGFTFDQVVLVPVIVEIISWLRRGELPRSWSWAIAAGLVLVYVVFFAMLTLPATYYHYFVWPPLALAGLYALAWKQRAAT